MLCEAPYPKDLVCCDSEDSVSEAMCDSPMVCEKAENVAESEISMEDPSVKTTAAPEDVDTIAEAELPVGNPTAAAQEALTMMCSRQDSLGVWKARCTGAPHRAHIKMTGNGVRCNDYE